MPDITHVIDTSALIAYFKQEEGNQGFADLLTCEDNVLAMHIINLGEVYYVYYRADGQDRAEDVWSKAKAFLRIDNTIDEEFMKRVGRWKGTNSMSYADAFAAALAENNAVPLVTTDHGDFDAIAAAGLLLIEWLR